MKSKFLKSFGIGMGALILSTLGIFASDSLQGIDSRISNFANVNGTDVCPRGMSAYKSGDSVLCVDIYEASVSESCPNRTPRSVIESEKNAITKGCYPASVPSSLPWTFVTLSQAQRICAEAGKRLPTSDEWYAFALGTDESSCMTQGSEPRLSGSGVCVSSAGVEDAVGNVWEWVNESVNGTEYRGRTLPQEGYVSEADASGVAVRTNPSIGDELYSQDYFWSKDEGVFGMLRGGFYGSGSDAGLYTVNASVPTNFATQGVGFRCVTTL